MICNYEESQGKEGYYKIVRTNLYGVDGIRMDVGRTDRRQRERYNSKEKAEIWDSKMSLHSGLCSILRGAANTWVQFFHLCADPHVLCLPSYFRPGRGGAPVWSVPFALRRSSDRASSSSFLPRTSCCFTTDTFCPSRQATSGIVNSSTKW